jgi:hypothetical protein
MSGKRVLYNERWMIWCIQCSEECVVDNYQKVDILKTEEMSGKKKK